MQKLFILIVLISAVYANPINEKADGDGIQYRLDETTLPVHYDLTITPYLHEENEYDKKQFTFDGIVNIELLPTVTKNTLRIHYKNLIIESQSIVEKESNRVDPITIEIVGYEEKSEILELKFSEDLVKDKSYILTFVYAGSMGDDMHGFYRSSYMENDQKVWMGSTQMQQTHARRVFPGFDEPLYKATFQLTMNKPKAYSVYSNTNQVNTVAEPIPGITTYDKVIFKKTPKMSSYLLVFIVSTFTRYTDKTNRDISFGILARKAQYDQSDYAYTFGKKALELLGRYMSYDYYSMKDADSNNLEKLDMAAIPDFSAGAMENWGLLTYRETNQLYDADYTTDITKQRIAAVIIHEQAHLWFGDLVTCAWWGDTWLNEGFARFFQYHGTSIAEPLWDVDKQFVVEQVQTALLFDSSESTHPMSHVVNTPAEASSIFNNISYNKGASILRMIQHLIGNTKFVEAIRTYIKKYEYTATKPEHLFKEFEEVAKGEYPELLNIITPWTTQANYPVITVTYDATTKKATVTQKVFLLKPDTTNTKTWRVPLTYTTRGQGFTTTKPSSILSSASMPIDIDTDGSWLIFNVQQTGYYRVNYDENNWKLIKAALLSENHDGIHEVNRAQIIDDLFNFARSGERTFEFAYEMFDYLKTEEHYIPWLSAFTTFNFLISKMNAAELAQFKQYVITLLDKSYKAVGWEKTDKDSQLTVYHRSNVINWVCKSGHAECIAKAKQLFDAYKADATKLVPINIRAAVYCSAMRHGTIEDLNYLWDKYKTQEIATEQLTILTAIGCANNKDVLAKAIENILSSSVREQDRRSALTNTYSQTEENVQIVLDYVVANAKKIEVGFGNDSGAVVTTLTSLASRFTTVAQVEQLVKFWTDNKDEYIKYETTFTNAISSARTQIEWNRVNIAKVISQIKVNTGVEDEDDAGGINTASFLVVLTFSFAAYLLNY
jgi:aminopeptidase N